MKCWQIILYMPDKLLVMCYTEEETKNDEKNQIYEKKKNELTSNTSNKTYLGFRQN